jgi:hypothetical protein
MELEVPASDSEKILLAALEPALGIALDNNIYGL